MDERAGAGAGAGKEMVMLWVQIPLRFFFSSHLRKFSKFFGGLIAGTRSAKFPVPVC